MLAACAAIVPYLFFAHPVTYSRLVVEDGWGEMATFAGFAFGAVVFLFAYLRPSGTSRNLWYLLIALGAAFFALEEISWGQRIVGVPTPDVLRKHNFQGELNLHNLSTSALHSYYAVMTIALAGFGLLVPIQQGRANRLSRLIDRLRVPVPPACHVPLYIAPALFWFLTDYPRRDEIVELIIGFALVGLAIKVASRGSAIAVTGRYEPRLAAASLTAIAGCLVAGIVLAEALNSSDESRRSLMHMAQNRLPNAGYYRQAKAVFDYLDRDTGLDSGPKTALARSEVLRRLGHSAEADTALRRGREQALEILEANPGAVAVRIDLSAIEFELGDHAAGRAHAQATIALLDVELATFSAAADLASDRPSWTTLLWTRHDVEKRAKLLMQKGDAHRALGQYREAANSYRAAMERSHWEYTRVRLRQKLALLAEDCNDTNARRGAESLDPCAA